MPKESLNIYLTATDQISPVLASITDKTRALDKESQQLQQTYEALQKANKGLIERKTELQKKAPGGQRGGQGGPEKFQGSGG